MERMIKLSRDEIHTEIPYAMICETRYGSRWNTMHRKRRWKEQFTEAEREKASKIFSRAYNWTLRTGVPEHATMSVETFRLWRKLGDFCAEI